MIDPTAPVALRSSGRPRTRLAVRLVAPLTALGYPGLIWCGSRTSAVVLASALSVPLLGLFAGHQLGLDNAWPRARRIAHVAMGAPPLFALLGGWLDFQHAIPISSLGVWLGLWSLLAVAAVAEPEPADPGRRAVVLDGAPSRLAIAHGISATVITLFAVAHLANHLLGLAGGAAHIAAMAALRTVYRQPLLEPVLLIAVAFQIATGVGLLRRKLTRPAGWFDTLQTATGAYLMVFFLSHVSAVLRARYLRSTDTNWTWLSGDELLTDPWSARLVPYYFLAVIAFGVHGACGLRTVMLGRGSSPTRAAMLVATLAGISALISVLILAGLFRA
jgi:succinate dehydrogenase/fumarate reductase cytochrome b subunit